MAAPIVETIWLVNGFKRHFVMAAPLVVTALSSVQNLMASSMISRGVLMIETILLLDWDFIIMKIWKNKLNAQLAILHVLEVDWLVATSGFSSPDISWLSTAWLIWGISPEESKRISNLKS